MTTATQLDPGIFTTVSNRRILHPLQLRNEVLFHKEKTKRDSVTLNVLTTATDVNDDNSLINIQRKQQAAGYGKLQFHYIVGNDGFVYTGLELNESTSLGNGDNITIGLVGSDKATLKQMSQAQIKSLVNIIAVLVKCFHKVRIQNFKFQSFEGLGQANIQPADLRSRADRIV